MKRYIRRTAAMAVIVAFGLMGCSRRPEHVSELTPVTARELLQDYFDQGPCAPNSFEIDYSPVAKLTGDTFDDYQKGSFERGPVSDQGPIHFEPHEALQRLVRAGLASQTTKIVVSVPDVTGSYSCRDVFGIFFGSSRLVLQQQGARITGNGFGGELIDSGYNVAGTITVHVLNTWYTPPSDYKVALSGGTVTLTSTDSKEICKASVSGRKVSLLVNHVTVGEEFLKHIDQKKYLSIGRTEVDKVSDLLLSPVSSNVALGKFDWHVDCDPVAQAFLGTRVIKGTFKATFGRRPDNTWTVTGTDFICS